MIRVQALGLRAGSFRLRDVSFEIDPGACLALLGPSGAGKTLLLETVLGLRKPDHGRIFMDGADVTDLAPERRGVSYVPQDLALFPHLSVKDNILFGLRGRVGAGEAGARLLAMADLLGIAHLIERPRVHALSGGEKQRVALARALVVRPRVLVLDEPFSSLDESLARTLREALRDLRTLTGVTLLHVTHDQKEAFYLADRIALMFDGAIEQAGTPRELWDRPATPRAAEFLLAQSFRGTVSDTRPGQDRMTVAVGDLRLVCPRRDGVAPGDGVDVVFRSESLRVVPDDVPPGAIARKNVFEAAVTGHVLQPDGYLVFATVRGLARPLEIHLSPYAFDDLGMRDRTTVRIALPAASIWTLPAGSRNETRISAACRSSAT